MNFHQSKGARQATRNLIKRGVIVREPCFVCASPHTEVHHTHGLEHLKRVQHLCRTHHARLHGLYGKGTRARFPMMYPGPPLPPGSL